MTTAAHTASAVSVPSFDLATTVAAWDALTPAEMRRRGSLKWSQPGETIGAWVAEMDLGTAPSVSAVLRRAVDTGTLGYMPASLAQQAREATARYESEVLGWQVPVERISLLPNVLSALGAIIEYHTRPGSAVIVPTPAYMPFLSIPGQHGRECIQVPALRTPASAASGTPGWALDLEPIESAMAAGAGLLVLCNPWNPVGRVLDPAELDAVAALSTRYGVPVFSDEIHAPLIVDPAALHVPYASRKGADPDLTFTATAASKGWNVPGLHCAQLIASGQARQTWQSHPRPLPWGTKPRPWARQRPSPPSTRAGSGTRRPAPTSTPTPPWLPSACPRWKAWRSRCQQAPTWRGWTSRACRCLRARALLPSSPGRPGW